MSETPRGAAWSAAWGVVAVVLGSGAVAAWMAAVAPGSKFPAWPAWMLGATTVVAVYMSFAFLSGRWPVNRSPGRDRRARLTQPQGSEVDLISEQAGERLRLGLVNHGSPAEYFAEVTGILDPLRRKIGPQHWPIPWLEDGSAGPKRIHSGQTRMLDFALYQEADVKAELNAGNGGTAHWRFSSVPIAINAQYYNLRNQADLDEQRFILTVRIVNASSGSYFDTKLMVGIRGSRLICELATNQRV